jgi:hypothetical protein
MDMDCKFCGLVRPAVIAAFLCLLPLTGIAEGVESLFEADVPVTGQQPELRTGYMKTALEEVLVRVTGQREVLNRASIRSMLANPERYVQQYRYYTLPDVAPPQLMLRVRFDGGVIQQALQQQGVAYWGNTERPDILVWLAVDDNGMRHIVSAQDDNDVHREMERAAGRRGIPILFPLMDLEDQARVRFAAIWGGFFDEVQTASERYNPQAVLIGRLNRSASGGWVARWNIPSGGDAGSWTGAGDQLGTVLQAGIDTLSGHLASRLAVMAPGVDTGVINVTVEGVNTLTAFARVDDYLASLTTIRRLELERVDASSLQYALQLNGTLDGLTQTIAIGTVLETSPRGTPGAYRLRQ